MEELVETVVQSNNLNRFLVIRTGWFKGINYYALIQDVEILKDKAVVIYADNTDTDLANDLVKAGIPAHKVIHSSSLAIDGQIEQGDPILKQQRIAA